MVEVVREAMVLVKAAAAAAMVASDTMEVEVD